MATANIVATIRALILLVLNISMNYTLTKPAEQLDAFCSPQVIEHAREVDVSKTQSRLTRS